MNTKARLIYVSFFSVFRVNGVTFDWHNYLGPIILSRNTERARKAENMSLRNWAAINKFSAMSSEEREQYRIF